MDKNGFEKWLQDVQQRSEETDKKIQQYERILDYYEKLEEARDAQLFQLYSNRIKREV